MDFDAWDVNLERGAATHASGFSVRIEGDPADPSDVSPGRFPEGISFVDQARLLRSGLTAIAAAAKRTGYRAQSVYAERERSTPGKSDATLQREAQARQFATRADKPERKVLSLKKSGD